MATTATSLVVKILGDDSDLKKKIQGIEKDFDPLRKNLAKVGKAMTKFVTLPILAAGAASVKAAIDFETSFAGVRKTIEATEDEFAGLRKGILDMSKELPSSANEIAAVAEAAGQLGIAKDNVLAFSRTMIDLGETTNLSANEAATAFARFANVTQMSQDDFDNLGSAVVDLGNNFATTEREIAEMALRLAGSGKQVGLAQSDILGFAAALSSVGVEAEAGGTAFSKLFARIAGAVSMGGSQLAQFANVAGMSAGEYAEAFRNDAGQATSAFIKGLGRISDQGGDTLQVLDALEITEIRMRDAILRTANAGDLLTDAISRSNIAWRENNALSKEAAQRYSTAASRLEIARNKMHVASVEIGGGLAPAFVQLVEVGADAASAFSDLDPAIQNATVAMIGMLAVAGPLAAAVGVLGATGSVITAALAGVSGGAAAAGSGVSRLNDHFEETGLGAEKLAASMRGPTIGASRFFDIAKEADTVTPRVSALTQGLIDAGFSIDTVSLSTQALIRGLEEAASAAESTGSGLEEDLGSGLSSVNTDLEKTIRRIKFLTEGMLSVGQLAFADLLSGRKIGADLPDDPVFGMGSTTVDFNPTGIKAPETPSVIAQMANQMKIDTPKLREAGMMAANALDETRIRMGQISNEMAATIHQGMMDAAAGLVEGMAEIFAGASDGTDALRQVLSTIAELAIRVGKIAIGVGLAVEGIRKALESLNPIAAIAAGVALIGVGAIARSALSRAAEPRAHGGPVTSGRPYIVGEEGPEMFVPRQSGTIVPNRMMGSSGQLVRLEIIPRALPSGDLVFAVEQGQANRLRGF